MQTPPFLLQFSLYGKGTTENKFGANISFFSLA